MPRLPRSRSVNELFAALSMAGIQILSMRNKANRLEELFLTLTERKPAVEIAVSSPLRTAP